MKDFRLLQPEDIEVKVKKVTAKGALLLLYKTARTDMAILDETVGPLGWTCDYQDIKGVLYCTISIRDPETGEWISKQDCGIESRADNDGNEVKGEASDAFKRAGFRWGIGRELYSAPFIWANVPTEKRGSGYQLRNPFQRFSVSKIEYNSSRKIKSLEIIDDKGNRIFSTGYSKSSPKKNPSPASSQKENPKNEIKLISKEEVREMMFNAIGLYGRENAQVCLKQLLKNLGVTKMENIPAAEKSNAMDFIIEWND